MLAAVLLTSCTYNTLTPSDSTTPPLSDTDTAFEDVNENGAVSDAFPVRSLTVADNDISLYTVVYSKNADDTVKYAAEEFVFYIHASTGIHLKCEEYESSDAKYMVHIGKTGTVPHKIKTKLTRMAEEGYYLLCDGKDLYITGNGERGTLYGVYSFLEKYVGVRYYTPSCERILKAEKAVIPSELDEYFVPSLTFRDCFWYEAFDPEFSAKQKINSCVSRDLTNYGGGVSYAGNFVHTLSTLAGTGTVSPCLTNDDVYTNVLNNAKKWLSANTDSKIISVTAGGDGSSKSCSCKNCTAVNNEEDSSVGAFIVFVNRLANDLRCDFPDVYVDALIPSVNDDPPKNTAPCENVIIRLSSVDACFSHSITECTSNNFDEHVTSWGERCENLYIWDYTTNFMYYLCPFPNLFTLFDNIKFYAQNNVKGLFEQGNYQSPSGEFGELRAYLISKLLWDPDMSREEYLAYMYDFLEGYYGEGWEYILEYINKTSEASSQSHMLVVSGVKSIMGKEKSSDELAAFAQELSNLWTKAYNATTETVCRRHVEKSKIQADYYSMYVSWDEEKHPELLENMYEIIQKYKITHFREGTEIPSLESFDKSPSTW